MRDLERMADELAPKIGQHCEDVVGVMDKIVLPYSSRQLRDLWVRNQLTAFGRALLERAAKEAEQESSAKAKTDTWISRKDLVERIAARIRALYEGK